MKPKLSAKQIMLIVMSVLLLTVIILTCVVIGKISSLFQKPETPSDSTPTGATDSATQPSSTPADPDATDSTDPDETPTVPSHVHNFVKTDTTKPTCKDSGFSLFKCECGQVEIGEILEAKGHSFGEGVHYEATEDEPAYTLVTCYRCGESEKQYDEECVHDYQFTQSVAGTCTEDAYDEYVCTLCNAIKKENLVPAPGHDFSDWSPVAEDPLKEKRTCAVCPETEYRDVIIEEDPVIHPLKNIDDPNWTHHILLAKYPTSGLEVTYDIWIGLENRNITYTYYNEGLMILYTVNGQTKTFMLPARTSSVMTVYSDGTCVNYAPGNEPIEPSEPGEPTDPSEPGENN